MDVSEEIRRSVNKICGGEVSNPDWISILELCDMVSSTSEHATETVRNLRRILGQPDSENTVSLALLVTESVLNNCPGFYTHIATRPFLQEIVALVDHPSPAVQERATRMLQDWATNSPEQPIFRDTYQQLKVQGIAFPNDETNAFATIPLSDEDIDVSAESYRKQPVAAPSSNIDADVKKLKQDLITVEEKIKTYRNMVALNISGEDEEDALDFLQQCQPRMNALIEAGLAGKLDEETLEACLTVNDHLISALEGKTNSSRASDQHLAGSMAHLSMTPVPAPLFTNADAV
ncbi:hypothetical protein AeRB84_013284 [Aphanomyces euteiches]|nr:hypothetical protein AeRB84_013284 [Aphanomyces euteiches]